MCEHNCVECKSDLKDLILEAELSLEPGMILLTTAEWVNLVARMKRELESMEK